MFYVIEGADGVGKTTLTSKVERILTNSGKNVRTVRFPGATKLGTEIRERLLNGQKESPLIAEAQACLMVSDMHLTLEEIVKPALDNDYIVLADRYYLSTIVYQLHFLLGNGIDQRTLFSRGHIFYGLLQPKRTFLVSASNATLRSRLDSKLGGKDFYEEDWEHRAYLYANMHTLITPAVKALMGFTKVAENNNEEDLSLIANEIANTIIEDELDHSVHSRALPV